MKEEKKKYPDAAYLYEHPGTDKYEVVELIIKNASIVNPNDYNSSIPVIFFDSVKKNIIVKSRQKSQNEKPLSIMWKIDKNGDNSDSISKTGKILKDGTLLNSNDYRNWIRTGDKTVHEINFDINNRISKKKEWIDTFNNSYSKADYVYLYEQFNEYLFKIEDNWYQINNTFNLINEEFKAKYPAKEDQDVRMIELEDLCPSFWSNPKTRDVSLIRELDYEVVDFEKGEGLNPINYSAGNYFFEVYMPGETITFKRYGAMGEHIKLYKIPTEYGGREDVLFIVLEPRNSDTKQASGMYVIRPRGIADEQQAE